MTEGVEKGSRGDADASSLPVELLCAPPSSGQTPLLNDQRAPLGPASPPMTPEQGISFVDGKTMLLCSYALEGAEDVSEGAEDEDYWELEGGDDQVVLGIGGSEDLEEGDYLATLAAVRAVRSTAPLAAEAAAGSTASCSDLYIGTFSPPGPLILGCLHMNKEEESQAAFVVIPL